MRVTPSDSHLARNRQRSRVGGSRWRGPSCPPATPALSRPHLRGRGADFARQVICATAIRISVRPQSGERWQQFKWRGHRRDARWRGLAFIPSQVIRLAILPNVSRRVRWRGWRVSHAATGANSMSATPTAARRRATFDNAGRAAARQWNGWPNRSRRQWRAPILHRRRIAIGAVNDEVAGTLIVSVSTSPARPALDSGRSPRDECDGSVAVYARTPDGQVLTCGQMATAPSPTPKR